MKRWLPLIVPVMFAVVFGWGERRGAEAAPVGAATGQFVYQQNCLANGYVQVRFLWTPSGWGPQFLDISLNAAFIGWSNVGPLPANQNFLELNNVAPNTLLYSRIATWAGAWLHSDPIAFVTIPCAGQFTPPTNLRSSALGPNAMRLRWDRGNDNLYFCVDTAFTLSDLLNLRGSWANWGCGTTATVLDITALACGRDHFWRVWARGTLTSGHSDYATFRTADCVFSPPTNPRTSNITSSSVRFSWTRGSDNQWFCVDVATSVSDLENLTGSFVNFGCLTTGTQVDVTGLGCGTTYHWRVFAQGTSSSGYSPTASFTTSQCPFSVPSNLRTDQITATSARFRWDPGNNNRAFCLDTAKTQQDLLLFGPTWSNNSSCGTTNTSLTLTTLECNTTYYWRVYALGANQAAYSSVATFKTEACS